MRDCVYALRLHHGHLDTTKQAPPDYTGELPYKPDTGELPYKPDTEESVVFYVLKGRIRCPLDNSEFEENQIVLITKCCRRAFAHHSLTNFINTQEKCPSCPNPIEPISVTILDLQTRTLRLEQAVEDLRSQVSTILELAQTIF